MQGREIAGDIAKGLRRGATPQRRDALEYSRLHSNAPAANPPGWGWLWMLGKHGKVLDVSADVIGMQRKPGGARLAYYRKSDSRHGPASCQLSACPESRMNVPAQLDLSRLTAADAEWYDQIAASKRAAADNCGDPVCAAQLAAEASGIEVLIATLRDPAALGLPVLRQGQGGETAPPEDSDQPWRQRELSQAVAATPTALAADASLARLSMARDAGVLPLAVEAAQDAGATTATEQMLAHQLAAAHKAAMGLFSAADAELHKHQTAGFLNPGALAEATRSATAGARVLSAFAQGAVAMDRLRNGNRQVVTVQHVTVADGGQGVFAGSVTTTKRQGSGEQ